MITLFASHEEVVCLRCDTDLGPQNEFGQLKMLQIGTWAKKCQKCKLVTSYDVDVTPREAAKAEHELEEPDWEVAFLIEQERWPNIPKHLREELAFEEVLKRWRRWHWTPTADDKKMPAPAIQGIIALTVLGVMPPRSAYDPVERDGVTGYQLDDHCWMISTEGELWRIRGVEDKMLHLEQNFDGSLKAMQVDLSKARWDRYISTMTEILRQLSVGEPPQEPPTEYTR